MKESFRLREESICEKFLLVIQGSQSSPGDLEAMSDISVENIHLSDNNKSFSLY